RKRHQHADDLVCTVERGLWPDQALQEHSAHDDLEHVPGLLADHAPERQSVVAQEQLCVDHELTDEDPGPEPESPEVEGGDAEPGRGPDRADRRRVAQALSQLRCAVVGKREREDRTDAVDSSRAQEATSLPGRPRWRYLHIGFHATLPDAPFADVIALLRDI